MGYKSQKSISSLHLKLPGKSRARQFKELRVTGKATLKISSKDWDVVLLSQLKLSKTQISKSADNPPLKKTIFSVVSMQTVFFSDLFGSGNIHHIEPKFHFSFINQAEESILRRKQETWHIPQD